MSEKPPSRFGFLPLNFLLRNVGHSPAFDIRVGVVQFFGYAEKHKSDLAKEEQEHCAALDKAYPPPPMVVEDQNFIPTIFLVTSDQILASH